MLRCFPHLIYRARALLSIRVLVALLAALVMAALFFPGLGGGFIFDDKSNIVDNVSLYMLGLDHVSAWRAANSFPNGPGLRLLPMLSFGLDYFRTGSFDPAAFKTTNLGIHVITLLVLAGFLRGLLIAAGRGPAQAGWLGLAMALLWAVHPLQVSSVMYVVQRMQTLADLFLLLALWAYLCMRQAQREGRSYWRAGCCAAACWLLALASKEDAALLPAYTLLLELTVLGFATRNPVLAQGLKIGYAVLAVLGLLAYVFWAIPRFGSLHDFPVRDFNSYERVLTQGRVLLMYLGQILWPVPDHMRFYYDDYAVSRGWLQPPATLVAWLLLASMVAVAWALRRRRPLFALGMLWFFAGHFVTSNVLGLELAFEHRNHFPMIGIILAVTDAVMAVTSRLRWGKSIGFVILTFALLGCGYGTWLRAGTWGDEMGLAEKLTRIAPTSGRAWVDLCRAHFASSHNDTASLEFGRAVWACQQGGEQAGSAMALANAIILESMREQVPLQDWSHLQARLHKTALAPEDMGIAIGLVGNADNGFGLDPDQVLDTIEILSHRLALPAGDNLVIARFILDKTGHPEQAYRYYALAARKLGRNDPVMLQALEDLKARGRGGWALRLAALQKH